MKWVRKPKLTKLACDIHNNVLSLLNDDYDYVDKKRTDSCFLFIAFEKTPQTYVFRLFLFHSLRTEERKKCCKWCGQVNEKREREKKAIMTIRIFIATWIYGEKIELMWMRQRRDGKWTQHECNKQ